ncbi:MAG: aminopeptidase P N-terminal domain-containing protein, partial [Microbacterium sp.]
MSETTTTRSDDEAGSGAQAPTPNRRQRYGQGFLETISTGWAERPSPAPSPREQAPFAARRRDALSAAFPGRRIVIPAGSLRQRSNDTDYPFRAHSAFAHLTGWGSDAEPDSLLVLDPSGAGHEATLFFRERADRTTSEFYSDATIGEFWIGPRPDRGAVAHELGILTAPVEEFAPTGDDLVAGADEHLDRFLSELRLVKDAYEIAQLRLAVEVTGAGFDDIVRELPRATAHARGERVIEGVFHQRARSDGNWEGYDTIAASGPHACYLHWTRNDGAVVPGDLVLIDAGVEVDSLYTA